MFFLTSLNSGYFPLGSMCAKLCAFGSFRYRPHSSQACGLSFQMSPNISFWLRYSFRSATIQISALLVTKAKFLLPLSIMIDILRKMRPHRLRPPKLRELLSLPWINTTEIARSLFSDAPNNGIARRRLQQRMVRKSGLNREESEKLAQICREIATRLNKFANDIDDTFDRNS